MKATYVSQFNYTRENLSEVLPLAAPFVVYIEPSSFCNLKCFYCPHSLPESYRSSSIMKLELFEKICHDMLQLPKRVKKMRFSGFGEPLFNKEFLAMVELASKLNVADNIEVITNGLLLNRSIIERLPQLVDKIIISVQSVNAAGYAKYSSAPVDFDAFIENVRALSRCSEKRSIIHAKIHHLAIIDEPCGKEKFESLFENYVDELFIEGVVHLWPETPKHSCMDNHHRFSSEKLKFEVCPQVFKSLQVNADGRVTPCCADWKLKLVVGDANSASLEDIWNGEALKSLRIKQLQKLRFTFAPCMSCEMNETCEIDNLDKDVESIIEKF